MTKLGRRTVLRGLGGLALGLPALEGLRRRGRAHAADPPDDSYAIFFRQGNGVACEQTDPEYGLEPERFWPRADGALTYANVEGRALAEFGEHLDRLLVVGNVNGRDYDYGADHTNSAMQILTAQGPVVAGAGDKAEAAGESIDHRIGRELNPGGRDSLFLYAGNPVAYAGGPCISYRAAGIRRAAIYNPMDAFATIMGLDPESADELAARQLSVNDVVRDQLTRLRASPKLSSSDLRRLDQHMHSVRELEVSLWCSMSESRRQALEGLSAGFASADGDEVLAAARGHMEVAALAVACGYTRSVAIQVGAAHDGMTRYRNQETGEMMENFHYISHRRLSHDSKGEPLPGADYLHHLVDRQFAQTFAYLLDRLSQYELPDGRPLIDAGVSVWHNDLSRGPTHSVQGVPFVLAGSAHGYLRQGAYVPLEGGPAALTHARLLNTIGAAAGLRDPHGDPIADFGAPDQPRAVLDQLLA